MTAATCTVHVPLMEKILISSKLVVTMVTRGHTCLLGSFVSLLDN